MLTGTSNLAGANVTLNSTVNGPFDLTVNASGTTTFVDVVGGLTPLASLTTDADGTTNIAGNVSTAGNQLYNDAVTLTGLATLAGDAVTLGAGASLGTNNLTIAAQNNVLLGGAVAATSGTVAVNANLDGLGSEAFTQNAGGRHHNRQRDCRGRRDQRGRYW